MVQCVQRKKCDTGCIRKRRPNAKDTAFFARLRVVPQVVAVALARPVRRHGVLDMSHPHNRQPSVRSSLYTNNTSRKRFERCRLVGAAQCVQLANYVLVLLNEYVEQRRC